MQISLKKHSKFSGLALKLLLAVVVSFSLTQQACAQKRPSKNSKDMQQFMQFYCVNVAASAAGLGELLAALRNLLKDLVVAKLDVGRIEAAINPPKLCLPTVDANLNIPGLDGLAQCLGTISIKVDIQLPQLDQISSCLSQFLPSLDFGINADSLLSCLGGINLNVDLPSISLQIASLIKRILGIATAIEHVLNSLELILSADMIFSLEWLANFCNAYNDGDATVGGKRYPRCNKKRSNKPCIYR